MALSIQIRAINVLGMDTVAKNARRRLCVTHVQEQMKQANAIVTL